MGWAGPGLVLAAGDVRLPAVIQHEADGGQVAGHADGRGQLSRADQQVIDEPLVLFGHAHGQFQRRN